MSSPPEKITANGKVETEGTGDNERLEFLGDAVLGLVVAEALFLLPPEWQEGELTRVRSQLSAASIWRSSSGHRPGQPSAPQPRRRQGRSQAQEHRALQHHGGCLGALFLDGGLEPVTAFVALGDGEAASN